VLDERDNVAALVTAATMPKLLLEIDAEPIITAAHRARPFTFNPATQTNAAALDLILYRHCTCARYPIFECRHNTDLKVGADLKSAPLCS
jgi:hypothetical protein